MTVPISAAATFFSTLFRAVLGPQQNGEEGTEISDPRPAPHTLSLPHTSIVDKRRTCAGTSPSPRGHGPHDGALWAPRVPWVQTVYAYPPSQHPTKGLAAQNLSYDYTLFIRTI